MLAMIITVECLIQTKLCSLCSLLVYTSVFFLYYANDKAIVGEKKMCN